MIRIPEYVEKRRLSTGGGRSSEPGD
jgi:hypothetical protein